MGHYCAHLSCILFHSMGSEGQKLISTYIDNIISLVATKSSELVFSQLCFIQIIEKMYVQIFKVDLRKKIFLKQGLKDQQGISGSYNITLRCIEFFAS